MHTWQSRDAFLYVVRASCLGRRLAFEENI